MLDQAQTRGPGGDEVAPRHASRSKPETEPSATTGGAATTGPSGPPVGSERAAPPPPPHGDARLQRALSAAVRRRADAGAGAGAYAPHGRPSPLGRVVARNLLQRDPALIKRVQDRMKDPAKFELLYSPDELIALIAKGRELHFDDQTIEDLLYTGSRKAKAISAVDLLAQMQFARDVAERKFPYRLKDAEEFKLFSQDLVDGVTAAGVPADDIRIQGSSLRKPAAGDVDVAVFVSEDAFAALLIARYHDKMALTKDGPKISLTGKTHAELLGIAGDIVAAGRSANAVARTFANAAQQGIISSKSDTLPLVKKLAKSIASKYPGANVESISVLRVGSAFDMKPDMKVT